MTPDQQFGLAILAIAGTLVAALGGAWVNGLVSSKAAREQGDRQQSQRLREKRESSYAEYLFIWKEMMGLFSFVAGDYKFAMGEESKRFFTKSLDLHSKANQLGVLLDIIGSPPVIQCVKKLIAETVAPMERFKASMDEAKTLSEETGNSGEESHYPSTEEIDDMSREELDAIIRQFTQTSERKEADLNAAQEILEGAWKKVYEELEALDPLVEELSSLMRSEILEGRE